MTINWQNGNKINNGLKKFLNVKAFNPPLPLMALPFRKYFFCGFPTRYDKFSIYLCPRLPWSLRRRTTTRLCASTCCGCGSTCWSSSGPGGRGSSLAFSFNIASRYRKYSSSISIDWMIVEFEKLVQK